MVASVAGFDPARVAAVARSSYALTLWTYIQRKESERFDVLVREHERIDTADMITRGFIQGTKPLSDRLNSLLRKVDGPQVSHAPETKEEMMQRAREQYARHHGLKIREH